MKRLWVRWAESTNASRATLASSSCLPVGLLDFRDKSSAIFLTWFRANTSWEPIKILFYWSCVISINKKYWFLDLYICFKKLHIIFRRNCQIMNTFLCQNLSIALRENTLEDWTENGWQRHLIKTCKILEYVFSIFVCKGLSWYNSTKYKILLIFIHTKQNFSRELETDVNYLVSPLCEKLFHTDLQAAQRKWKAKKIYTRNIYKYVQKIREIYTCV